MILDLGKYRIETCYYSSNKYDLKEIGYEKDNVPVYRTVSYGMSFEHIVKKIARGKLNNVKFDDISEMFATFESTVKDIVSELEKKLK